MSMDARARGHLEYPDENTLTSLLADLDDDEAGLLDVAVQQHGAVLTLDLGDGVGFSNQGYLDFYEWLEDLVDGAERGHVDLWYDELGDEEYVRLHADGREETVAGPFPG